MKLHIPKDKLENLGTPEQRKKAVEALRSGKYEKHKGEMTDPNDKRKACCLMVVAQEVDGMPWDQAIFDDSISRDFPDGCSLSPESLSVQMQEAFEVISQVDGGGWQYDFACVNDGANTDDPELTHPQIGDLLDGQAVEIE